METKTEPKLQIRYCNINKLFYLYGITDKKEIEMATFKSLVAARKEAYQPLEEMSSYKKLTLDDKLSLIGL